MSSRWRRNGLWPEPNAPVSGQTLFEQVIRDIDDLLAQVGLAA